VSAAAEDIKIDAGSDFEFAVRLKNGTAPIDATGWRFFAELRDARDRALISSAQIIPLDTLGIVTGIQFHIKFPGRDTEWMEDTPARYDVLAVEPDNTPRRILEGNAQIRSQATANAFA